MAVRVMIVLPAPRKIQSAARRLDVTKSMALVWNGCKCFLFILYLGCKGFVCPDNETCKRKIFEAFLFCLSFNPLNSPLPCTSAIKD